MRLVIKGIRSESLTDTLAAAGHTLNQGDAIILQVSGGKAIGAAPYSDATLVEATQLTDGAKLKVFRAESVRLDGKGPIYRNVTKEYAPQIAKAEGKNFAAAAGKEGVGGEYEAIDTSLSSRNASGQRMYGPTKRPSWRQSEIDAATDYPEYSPQKSFIRMSDGIVKEVPYGTKGSIRPDYHLGLHSIDIKNYDIVSAKGRSRLVNDIV